MNANANDEESAITELLLLAEVNYQNKNYNEAFYYYDKTFKMYYNQILKMGTTYHLALLRYSICQTIITKDIKYRLDNLKNIFRDLVSKLKESREYDAKMEEYAQETIVAVDTALEDTKQYLNSYTLTLTNIDYSLKKLRSIYELYEAILQHTKENNEYVILKIIETLKELMADRINSDENGTYHTNNLDKMTYQKLLETYQKKLNGDNRGKTGLNKGIFVSIRSDKNIFDKVIVFLLLIGYLILIVGGLKEMWE